MIGFNEWTYKQLYSFCVFFPPSQHLENFQIYWKVVRIVWSILYTPHIAAFVNFLLPLCVFSLPFSTYLSTDSPLLATFENKYRLLRIRLFSYMTTKLYPTRGDSQICTLLWRARIAELCRWYSLCGNASWSLNKRAWTTWVHLYVGFSSTYSTCIFILQVFKWGKVCVWLEIMWSQKN